MANLQLGIATIPDPDRPGWTHVLIDVWDRDLDAPDRGAFPLFTQTITLNQDIRFVEPTDSHAVAAGLFIQAAVSIDPEVVRSFIALTSGFTQMST